MRRDDIDFHAVRDEHLGIHERLLEWARWVKVRPHGWQVSPMFRQYRSHAWQWHERTVKVDVNIPNAVETEKAVSLLPEPHRSAIRWAYVACNNPSLMAQKLATNKAGLLRLLVDGRTMLRNRTKESDERSIQRA